MLARPRSDRAGLWGLLLPFEPVDGVVGDRGEQVDEVAIRIVEEDGRVPPGHECWLLLPLADDGVSRSYSASTSSTTHSMMADWLWAGRACC